MFRGVSALLNKRNVSHGELVFSNIREKTLKSQKMLSLILKVAKTMKQQEVKKNTSNKFLIIGILIFLLAIGSAFFGGFYFQKVLNNQGKYTSPNTLLPPKESDIVESSEIGNNYIKDKQYFDDTVIAITESDPHKILIATISRQETIGGANQGTRVSFFNGEKWVRKSTVRNYETTQIYPNDIVTQWKINIDPSRVLKQQVLGSVEIDSSTVSFDTNIITNNIAIRSLPDYTKFMSTGDGVLTINDISLSAKILYTRIYSNNSQGIQFYETPIGLTTNWLAFWDTDGNFYHIDSTFVDNPTDNYQTHELAVLVDKEGRVSKSFDVRVITDSEDPPSSYKIQLGSPINQVIDFTKQKSINKAPNNSYIWFMSSGIGQVGETDGFGLVEYIRY